MSSTTMVSQTLPMVAVRNEDRAVKVDGHAARLIKPAQPAQKDFYQLSL